MASPTLQLIDAIRKTARRLETSDFYQWGHMGSCNCGFLAQEITQLSRQEIHRRAMLGTGDWSEQLNDYCPASGLPMDEIISSLLNFGLEIGDLQHLERLNEPLVVAAIRPARELRFNVRSDAVLYMNTWARILEEQLLKSIRLPLLAHDSSEKEPQPEIEESAFH